MIGGINSNGFYPSQSGALPARERTDVARNPATGPEKTADAADVEARRDLLSEPGTSSADGRGPGSSNSGPSNPGSSEGLERRVEARKAAEDARLERFRADDVPFATSRALATFADVAGQRDGEDTELAGIDIRV